MLTFLEVGFGGNLVHGFRAYAWRAVPSFPQIALWGPSFTLWPQPFKGVIVVQLRTKWLQKGNTCRLRGLTLRAPTSVKLKRSWAPIMRELVHLGKPILELTLCQRRNILLIFLDSLHWLIVLSLPRFTFQLKSGRKHNINNEASLIKSLYASA